MYGGSRSEPKEKYDFKYVALDVTKEDSIKAAVDQIVKAEGTIDVLINNAGYMLPIGSVQAAKLEDHRRMFDINYIGYIAMTNAVLPVFFKNKDKTGHIINVTSCLSTIGPPWMASYAATKAAIDRMTEGYNIELKAAGANVTVQMLAPGYCPETSLFAFRNLDDEAEEYKPALSMMAKMMKDGASNAHCTLKDVANSCVDMVNQDEAAKDFRVYAGAGSRQYAEVLHTDFNLNYQHNVDYGLMAIGLKQPPKQPNAQ